MSFLKINLMVVIVCTRMKYKIDLLPKFYVFIISTCRWLQCLKIDEKNFKNDEELKFKGFTIDFIVFDYT